MSELIIVTGAECLEYVNKPIGFGSREDIANTPINAIGTDKSLGLYSISSTYNDTITTNVSAGTRLAKLTRNSNNRIVGLVLKKYDDGGLCVAILGNETIHGYDDFKVCRTTLKYLATWSYRHIGVTDEWDRYDDYGVLGDYPPYEDRNIALIQTGYYANLHEYGMNGDAFVGFDDAIDYKPVFIDGYTNLSQIWRYQGIDPGDQGISSFTLTNDKNNTLVFGQGVESQCIYDEVLKENPLSILSGNLYGYCCNLNFYAKPSFPRFFPDTFTFENAHYSNAYMCENYNLCALPFNLLLTENEQFALEYLSNGTLPPDAFLYPLDWDNLPSYDDVVPTGDAPENYDDDNDPDDDTRDFDPTPPENVSFTVNQFTNYNWYWLTVPQWNEFINWFWNDIGAFHDFDDIIAKVEGLYTDVASAVIMCRYYPVDISWIGGTGTQDKIKLGMIEKDVGVYDTINQSTPLSAQYIGHQHISNKYKSFLDLTPYSQISLYLPFHGFIDLDNDLFTGHDVYVYATYDYLSGTIQYYIYYDNTLLVNTILCKMAMDIPITLQTKNDRDSAIFNNVSSTIGGLVGAGVGIASGNPVGIALGATQGVSAINSSNQSAPMRLMGNVGETGAYIGFQQCFVIIRRPTIQPSDGNSQTNVKKGLKTWKHNVGMLCGYGYKLSNLSGKGFTVCHTPRIDFKNSAPLQSEVDDIYDYLSKGVIL